MTIIKLIFIFGECCWHNRIISTFIFLCSLWTLRGRGVGSAQGDKHGRWIDIYNHIDPLVGVEATSEKLKEV